jgi:glycosyltransferase involved in cell wall biosynthesis
MYPPHHLGGYELMWQAAVRALRARGHEVRVLTTDHSEGAGRDEEDADVHRALRWYWRDHEFPRMSLRARRALESHNQAILTTHLEALEPDVVSWWAMGGMSMSLLEAVRRRRTPAVGVVVDDWLVYGPEVDGWQRAVGNSAALASAAERLTGIPTRLRLAQAAEWVFVSERVRRRAAQDHPGLSPGRIAHGGIDPALFPQAPEREWGGRLLYLGRIDPRKGIAIAVRALAELPDAQLAIVGGGDERHATELRDLAAELGVAERVSFSTARRDELAEVYAAADAVLFPVQWAEPWGLVPLEAMSVGRPVIATGTGGSGEYLRDGENCLLFEPRDDPAALAGAVRALAADASLRTRLREGGVGTVAPLTEDAFNDAVAAAHEDALR